MLYFIFKYVADDILACEYFVLPLVIELVIVNSSLVIWIHPKSTFIYCLYAKYIKVNYTNQLEKHIFYIYPYIHMFYTYVYV